MAKKKSKYLSGRRIDPRPITGGVALADLVDEMFLAYNAARLREACQLFTQKMLEPDVTVGLSITGALTPAGLGISALIPLMRAGFVDWIITTGANLYHDTHFGIGLALHLVSAQISDIVLRAKRGAIHGQGDTGHKHGGKSAVFILGGGSPKNFMLQTEPQIQEVLGIDERGHDYFLQVTDARPDTGGLSGATPAEAVSWGKVDPDRLPDAVVCYVDSTIALPLIAAYALARHEPRELKRLYERREELMKLLLSEYEKSERR